MFGPRAETDASLQIRITNVQPGEVRPNSLMQLASRQYAGPELKLLYQRVRRRHVSCSSLPPSDR
jgi:hypothetical protein